MWELPEETRVHLIKRISVIVAHDVVYDYLTSCVVVKVGEYSAADSVKLLWS